MIEMMKEVLNDDYLLGHLLEVLSLGVVSCLAIFVVIGVVSCILLLAYWILKKVRRKGWKY